MGTRLAGNTVAREYDKTAVISRAEALRRLRMAQGRVETLRQRLEDAHAESAELKAEVARLRKLCHSLASASE